MWIAKKNMAVNMDFLESLFLLIDDNRILLFVTKDHLRNNGFILEKFGSEDEARAEYRNILRAMEKGVSVYYMPEISGM